MIFKTLIGVTDAFDALIEQELAEQAACKHIYTTGSMVQIDRCELCGFIAGETKRKNNDKPDFRYDRH